MTYKKVNKNKSVAGTLPYLKLVEISVSSVGRVVSYNARGPGIESHQGHCIFRKVKHALLLHWRPTK